MCRLRPNLIFLVALALGTAFAFGVDGSAPSQAAPETVVLVAELDDQAITPATAAYLSRAIEQANLDDAECLVILLDTPGGLVDSTRVIVKRMLASRVPVVVYVAPAGARAASAGVFVTLASHVAAMAPSTTIGAAHPVQVGGLPTGGRPSSPAGGKQDDAAGAGTSARERKVVNDTVAWARSLAQLRGRNADWAADAVRTSDSLTASEAAEHKVVELRADDLHALLAELHGHRVSTAAGPRTLETSGARVQRVPMWWGERVQAVIAQPNVAFLLMVVGFYGVLFEFYSPGWGVSGTLGAICLLLGLFGLAVLPINYLGLALLAVALALFAAEVFVTSYGALAVGGIVCMVLGGTMLVDSPAGFARVSLSVLLPVAAATAAITFFLVGGIVRSHGEPAQTGGEALIGAVGRAADSFVQEDGHYRGDVLVRGERWRAVSWEPLQSGDACRVEDRDGLTLTVS